MGRSVSYASGSAWIGHTTFDTEEFGELDGYYAWAEYIDEMREKFRRAFPSLEQCDRWLGREDRAILENAHCYIGVSEYCGLVSVWCVAKDDNAMAPSWCAQIEKRALKLLNPRLRKVGTFSNGEAIFERASA